MMEELSKRNAFVVDEGLPWTVETPLPKVPNVANGMATGETEPKGQDPSHTASMQLGSRLSAAAVVNSQIFSIPSPPHSDVAVTGLKVATLVKAG